MTTQTCIVTGKPFVLSPQEQAFYEKNNLPFPKLSPLERWRRRMCWRNDRTFWRRKCDATGEMFIAAYPESLPAPVYKPSAWWSDDWDALEYGQEFDFTRPFFEQWNELFQKVPRLGIDIVNCENSDFCNYCGDDKNCYLDIAGEGNEDCYFDLFTKYSRNCVDCTFVYSSELCYELINGHNCYEVLYSMNMENCNDCAFSFDLKGCNNCLFCSNLRQQEYCIENQKVTKEEFLAYKAQMDLEDPQKLKAYYDKWLEVMQKAYHRDMVIVQSENCTGNNIQSSKNCAFSFNITNCEDGAYLFDVLDAKDCYDLNYSLYKPETSCELISTLAMTYSAYCMASHYCSSCFYCDQCNHSSDLFGCIGLNQKKFCILNKQYSEEEYKELKAKIIEHMKQTGEWGQFFPEKLSPFAYNETVAQEYLPLPKETIEARGLAWAEESTPSSSSLEGENILRCEISGKPFRLIDQEKDFYKKMKMAPPGLCPDQRHLRRMNIRPPRWLYDRACSVSGKKVLSSYAPSRPEKVLCEEEYLKVIN